MATSAVSSGIDVQGIVAGLMQIERMPIDKLNKQQQSYQSKISALGNIQSQMANLQTAVKALNNTSTSSLVAFKSTSSDTTILSATADSTAAAGNYSINVTNLAQSQNLVATGQTSSSTAISDGVATTVTFDFGTITGGTLTNGAYTGATFNSSGGTPGSIVIDGTNNSLTGIRDAINAAGLGVTATIVNDGSASPYRLTLTSSTTGAASSVKITTSGGDGTINTLLAHDPGGLPSAQHLNQTVEAKNANFTVNGIAATNASNTVTNVIQGVTLNLSKDASSATLSVGRDTSAVTSAVNGLVTAYNSLYSSMRNAYAYKSGSVLEGDTTLRNLQLQMRSVAAGVVTGGTMSNLGEAGISFKTDGTMQLDSSKLSSAMTTNFADVAHLFNSATGFATKFDTFATASLAPDGAFATHTDKFNRNISDIVKRVDSMESRMKNIESRYRYQYSQLNILLSSMNSTSAYLTQQLSKS